MNPTPPDDRDQLIAGAGGDAWESDALPREAARVARRGHRVRQTIRAGATATLILLGAVAAWQLSSMKNTDAQAGASVAGASSAKPAPAYEIITDEQLRRELAKQSVMITEQNGRIDAVIWLDR